MNTKLERIHSILLESCLVGVLMLLNFFSVTALGQTENQTSDSIFFQQQWLKLSGYPEKIDYYNIEEAINEVDSLIRLAENEGLNLKEARLQQFMGRLLLQVGQNTDAEIAFKKGLELLSAENAPLLRIKILSGLGELELVRDQVEGKLIENSGGIFRDVFAISRENGLPEAMTWIFYHKGGRYLVGDKYTREEIKAVVDYGDRELYNNPTKALELANWLIENAEDHPIHVWDGLLIAGLVYRDWGEFHKALELFDRAMILSRQSIDENRPLFMAMLNTAAVFSMQDQFEESLKLTMEVVDLARDRGESRSVAFGLKDIGLIYIDKKDYDKGERYLLEAIEAMNDINNKQGVAVCEVNLANLYLQLGQPYKSITYLEKAAPILKSTGYEVLYAGSLLTKANAYLHTEEWRRARALIEEGLELARNLNSLEYEIAAHQNWVIYYAHAGNPQKVMSYSDSMNYARISYNKRDRKQISESYKVRFDTERKEAQLTLQLAKNESLAIVNNAQRKQRNVLLSLALIFIILLVLLANRYQLRKKLAIEQEARLTDKVKVSELEQAKKEAENTLLEEKVQHKQRELASLTLQMAQKNDALQELEQNIRKSLHGSKEFSKESVREILNLIGNQKTIDKDWNTFKAHFEQVHTSFFDKLRTKHPDLSQTEEKHSAYIRMGLSTKEIARLMNISPSSVQVARYRLKKKLAPGKDTDIYQYINSI